MASIREFKGKWQVQIRLKGYAPVARSFDRQTDAIKWGEKEEARLKRERAFGPALVIKLNQPKCSVTLGNLIDRFITEVTSNRRTEKAVETQTYELNAFKREPICDKLLTELSVEDFNCYVLERLKKCRKRTIKRQLSVIRNALDIGKRIWLLPSSPEWVTDLGFKDNSDSRQRRLAEGEYDKLMNACDRIGTNFKSEVKIKPRIMKLIIQVALLTSMRRAEILNLRWSNIRFQESYIHVPESKTNSKRDIPLIPDCAKLLAAFHPERVDDTWVFPFHFEALDSAWGRLTERAGVEDFNFHDLRHEALSRLAEAGVTPVELMMFSGHKSLDQLSKYLHGSRKNVLSKFSSESSLLTSP